MNTIWPLETELAALCRLLARPSPPVVASDRLRAARSCAGLAEEIASNADRDLAARMRASLIGWRRGAPGGLLTFYDAAYPELLRQIARPPLALFVLGDPTILAGRIVAMVGARAASRDACAWTHATASDLARYGVVIASGLARGIDAAAHEGALDAGGRTIAVQGCGPDLVYPPEHAALAARIAMSGCLVTEFPPGTQPIAWHFPMRNRILAGLASGVVVVQAEMKSGALVTARAARDENREVMAVPGDVGDPRSCGPHALLRDGAALVDDAASVLETLRWSEGESAPDAEAAAVLSILATPTPVDQLPARLGWPAAQVQRVLAELELAGVVQREPGGVVRRARC